VPLTSQDHVLALTTPDEDGLVEGVARAAEAEGIGVSRLPEPSPLPGVLAQIPLVARLHLLALRFATTRGQDPDTVITGRCADRLEQSLDTLTSDGRDRDGSREPRRETRALASPQPVDLVERHDLGHVGGPDLLQHPPDRLDLALHLGSGSVRDVQEQVRK